MKNKFAVTLGRLGGLKGGLARAKVLSPERRKEIARHGARVRWGMDRETVVTMNLASVKRDLKVKAYKRYEQEITLIDSLTEEDILLLSDIVSALRSRV